MSLLIGAGKKYGYKNEHSVSILDFNSLVFGQLCFPLQLTVKSTLLQCSMQWLHAIQNSKHCEINSVFSPTRLADIRGNIFSYVSKIGSVSILICIEVQVYIIPTKLEASW